MKEFNKISVFLCEARISRLTKFFSTAFFSLSYLSLFAVCSGGTPAGNINPNLTWQTISANTYTYYTFDAAYAGEGFIFSFCQGGGNNLIDTQLEIHDNTGNSIGSFNDDACGTGSELIFNAPSSGTFRISIYRYNCQTTSVAAGTLAYKKQPLPNEQDCLGAISVCQPIYNQNQSYFGYGTILDYTSSASCPGLCVETENLSVWYTFQVQQSGVLDFRITPNDGNSDYDWALFNLTNHDCSILQSISSNTNLIVSCNAAYNYGTTGVNSITPSTNSNCQGPSSFGGLINNPVVNVTAGQIYYLNIQNWSATQGGYTLDFGNSTASIFDNFPPIADLIGSVDCTDEYFTILFNENVECNSIEAGDFSLTGPGGPYTVEWIYGGGCSVGGIMEREFDIHFSPPISTSGTFTINYNGDATDMCGNTAFADSWTFDVLSSVSMTLSSAGTTQNQAICLGDALTNITWTSIGGNSATISGLPDGVSGNYNQVTGQIIISGTPSSSGTFNYSIVLFGDCGSVSTNGTITVSTTGSPTFNSFGPYCLNDTPASLPTNSNNGISGTWSPANISTSSPGDFTYTFTPTAGQCAPPVIITVEVNDVILPTFDNFGPYCFGTSHISLPTVSNNGVNGYWTPSSIITNQEGPSTYIFTPTSGLCTSEIETFVVITPLPVVLAEISTPIDCNGNNGTVIITASGGAPPYTGVGSFSAGPGSHQYVVTDNYGCEGTTNVTLIAPPTIEAEIEKISDIDCYGKKTGQLSINITQGTPSYNISWTGASENMSSSSFVLDKFKAGDYSITITDANGCTLSRNVSFMEPAKLEVLYSISSPTCIGNSDGFVEIAVSGGTQPYFYIWDDVNIQTPTIASLRDGRYRLIIRDGNNCLVDLGEIFLKDYPVDCLNIPNAFSPNGDGVNDLWEIGNIELFPGSEARIFNRWGQVLYYGLPENNPWDGYYNGKRVPSGTYVYVIQTFTGMKYYTGTVTVVH